MNIIIPMAGMGKRMRPHTLTTPKPLLPIAGKPIVQRLVESIHHVANHKIANVAFVIGRSFGEEVENELLKIADNIGANGHIRYQDEALGTAHAVFCAKDFLDGHVIVGFADTLFRADFTIDPEKDGVIWVQKVEDPRQFGVVKVNSEHVITDFVEKPENFVSDLAIIGIYYFKNGGQLRSEIQHLLDNDIKEKGEYQLTNALENMRLKGSRFEPGQVIEWMDCGNKNATVLTNQRVLATVSGEELISPDVDMQNAEITEPCYIGKNVKLHNVKIGPYVSIGDNTTVKNSVISNSIIQCNTEIINADLTNSMIGNFVIYDGEANEVSLSDYSTRTR